MSTPPLDSPPDITTVLPGYTYVRELGRGAMGIVYLAHHDSLDRFVAVKELQGALAADPATRSRFTVEAKVMASLDHPHVVPVFDFVERDDRCVLVMEQLPGGTVWDRFVSTGVTMPVAVAITLATCAAMQHAHDHDVLHRDIKPENLMFDGDDQLKVTDFGIARVVNGPSTKATLAGSVLGTPAYMAPEQAEGKPVSPAVDVYAAATMTYEMLSGQLPFERVDSLGAMLTQRILHDPTPLTAVSSHVPNAIAAATMRALARTPAGRTSSAEAFGVELASAAAEAWGPTWLDATGIVVTGSDAIERAARSTSRTQAAPSSDRPSGANSTLLPGDVVAGPPRRADTVIGAERPATPIDPDPVDEVSIATPDEPADFVPVKPAATDRDLGRARADEIDELIDISAILASPPRPVAQWALAAGLFLAALAWAILGGGQTDRSPEPVNAANGITFNGSALDLDSAALDPIDFDLVEPIVIAGLAPDQTARVRFTQLGVPVGTTSGALVGDGTVGLDTGFLGRITSGAVDATIEITASDGTEVASIPVAARATNPWYLTAAGLISSIVVLFAIATIESYLRAFRRGRNGAGTFVGLVVAGALLGASGAAVSTIVFGTERGLIGVVGPAALAAAGAISLGLAARANRRRRRAARQELRHTAIKALAGSRG